MTTEADCRAYGLPESQIESMRRKGFFHPVSAAAEARDDIRDEIEEIDADLPGLVDELRELKARIAAMKARRAELVAKHRTLRPAAK
jgi:uncharacterized coiled-coil DUF342 family protein